MTEPAADAPWPHWILAPPPGASDDDQSAGVQAAVQARARGAPLAPGRRPLLLTRRPVAALEPIRRDAAAEWARLGWPAPDWRLHALADAPWALAWRKDFHTLPIGRRLLVRPDWETDTPAAGHFADRLTLWIRPGMGFGTGRHETTRLALERLESTLRPGDDLLDFGSGSGLLAIAAALLGARRVVALEADPQANENARDNIALNQLDGRLQLVEANDLAAVQGQFDLIVCNMLPHEALPHLAALASRLKGAESTVIYSGFLADEKEGIENAMRGAGLQPFGFQALAEWGAYSAHPR